MTDYISRQEAINVAQNYHCSHDITIIPNTDYSRGFYDGLAIRENDILQGLSELKLVADVVEARCKNCENWDIDWKSISSPDKHYCVIMDKLMDPDDFCSYGERKE